MFNFFKKSTSIKYQYVERIKHYGSDKYEVETTFNEEDAQSFNEQECAYNLAIVKIHCSNSAGLARV
jgi:hypothetical protein